VADNVTGTDETKSRIDLGFGVIQLEPWDDASSTFTEEHRAKLIRLWSKGPLAIEHDRLCQARREQKDAERRRKYEAASEREGFERWPDVEVEEGPAAPAAHAALTGRRHFCKEPPAPAAPAQSTAGRHFCEKQEGSRLCPDVSGSLGHFSKLLMRLPVPRAEDWQMKHQKQVNAEKKNSYRDNTKGCATPACLLIGGDFC